ncbi:MAG: TolC family protein, partial [Longimicrobiales bacterium]
NIKQRLRLESADSITLDPVLNVEPLNVDVERAIELATTLAPRLRQLAIDRRENEIELEQTRGNDSFRMNVGLTYGREMQDPRFEDLWSEPRNSYTINVSGYIPIWDWGEHKYRVQAEHYSLEQTDLEIEEARTSIETDVASEVRNLEEYEQRALDMQENLAFARRITATTIDRYRTGEVDLVALLQTIDRESTTARNFLDAYLGFQNALLRLQELTYYDFERDMPLLDRFHIEPRSENEK